MTVNLFSRIWEFMWSDAGPRLVPHNDPIVTRLLDDTAPMNPWMVSSGTNGANDVWDPAHAARPAMNAMTKKLLTPLHINTNSLGGLPHSNLN